MVFKTKPTNLHLRAFIFYFLNPFFLNFKFWEKRIIIELNVKSNKYKFNFLKIFT